MAGTSESRPALGASCLPEAARGASNVHVTQACYPLHRHRLPLMPLRQWRQGPSGWTSSTARTCGSLCSPAAGFPLAPNGFLPSPGRSEPGFQQLAHHDGLFLCQVSLKSCMGAGQQVFRTVEIRRRRCLSCSASTEVAQRPAFSSVRGHPMRVSQLPGRYVAQRALLWRQGARSGIDHAQRTDAVAVQAPERYAGVEADVGCADRQRVVGEAFMLQRVLHHEHVIAADGMTAERHRTRQLGRSESDTCLESLALRVHQRQHRSRHLHFLCGVLDQMVQARICRRIEHVQPALGALAIKEGQSVPGHGRAPASIPRFLRADDVDGTVNCCRPAGLVAPLEKMQ